MKTLLTFILLLISFSSFSKKIPIYYPIPHAETFEDFIFELQNELIKYPQISRLAYIKNHPNLALITGLSKDNEELRLRLYDFFIKRGYYVDIPQVESRITTGVESIENRIVVDFSEHEIFFYEFGMLSDTAFVLENMNPSIEATNFHLYKINRPSFVIVNKRIVNYREIPFRAILYEEFFEMYFKKKYDKKLDLLKGESFIDLGIPDRTQGKSQILNLLGSLLNISIDDSEENIKKYLLISLVLYSREFHFEFIKRDHFLEPQAHSYYLLSKGYIQTAKKVDPRFRKIDQHLEKLRKRPFGYNDKDLEKFMVRIMKDWNKDDFEKFSQLSKEMFEEGIDAVKMTNKTFLKSKRLKHFVLLSIALFLVAGLVFFFKKQNLKN